MRSDIRTFALGSVLLASSAMAGAVTIGFDDLPSGTVVTNQYAGVSFSSSLGNSNAVVGFKANKFICTAGCLADTYLDFTTPVNGLTFLAIEPNFNGPNAEFRIFQNGVFTATVQLIGLGGDGNKLVDLSAYSNITRLEIVNILNNPSQENGIGWDSFSFAPVPEPGTYALMLAGLAGVGIAARRRRG
jgi:hypothetical protein